MAKKNTLKITSISNKINQLKAEFGESSDIVKFATDALRRNMGGVPKQYLKKDGSINVNKLVTDYDKSDANVKDLESQLTKLKGVEGASKTRAWLQNELKKAKAERRELKQKVYVSGEEVIKSLQTPNQIYGAEIKAIKEKSKAGEPLSEIEQNIASAKSQKEIRNNEEYKDYLTNKANITAQRANQFNNLSDSLYEMARTDPDVPEVLKEQAWDLYNKRTFSPNWLAEADELVASWYGGMIARDWDSLTR